MANVNMQSNISLKIGGSRFEAWQTASISRAFDAVAGTFSLSFGAYDHTGKQVSTYIKPFDACTLYLEDETVITGYIDDISISYTATSHTLSVSGRDKTADLVDCSAIHKPDEWHNMQVEYLANVLCAPFGIKAKVETDTKPVVKFRLEQGETAFEALDRLCRMQGLIANSNPSGEFIITRKSTVQAGVKLEHGVNILSANFSYSGKDLFSDYLLKGQQPHSESKSTKTAFNDASVSRFRPLLILAEDIASKDSAGTRLDNEVENRKAKARQVSVTVQGWREQENGALWLPNKIIHMKDIMLDIDETFFISKVDYSYSGQGSITKLTLESIYE